MSNVCAVGALAQTAVVYGLQLVVLDAPEKLYKALSSQQLVGLTGVSFSDDPRPHVTLSFNNAVSVGPLMMVCLSPPSLPPGLLPCSSTVSALVPLAMVWVGCPSRPHPRLSGCDYMYVMLDIAPCFRSWHCHNHVPFAARMVSVRSSLAGCILHFTD